MNFFSKIAKVVKSLSNTKSSFKQAIYDQLQGFNNEEHFKKIYKIVIEIVRNRSAIEGIIDTYFSDDNIKDRELLMVFIYEYYFSDRKVKIGGKLMKMVKSKKDEITKHIEHNNLKISHSDSEIMYFRPVKGELPDFDDIEQDEFIEGLYSVNKKSQCISELFGLRDMNRIIIQTKSSCIPAYLLSKYAKCKDFDIIDTCSAPGNKTLQLSEYFEKSKIFAFEIDEGRYNILKDNVAKYGRKNINPLNQDFLSTDPNDTKYSKVKVILSDPSCSGSGTQNNSLEDNRMNNCCLEIAGSEIEEEKLERLRKLASFQSKILEHCMKFPGVKYISYSTCSVFMIENEYVVNKVLEKNKNFKLISLDKYNEYTNFHRGVTEETKNSLRVCRKCHSLDGFYVAIFERQ
jgi:putative methyltransferase